ncbi:MAG: hypothetical protein CMF77_02275 [Candidatus Marinimicrobia bacterium]|nr:hypothetical protein [Candidatus Neomarinimicrobiota bacterium]|tara:strand:+ start:17413 stop:18084 length:672 start_codon:yes stop_codon:yes gene_type:complete
MMNRIQVPIFELENTRVDIGGRSILKIGKFQFHRGTIYGIVGSVGAGKTTLLSLLAGRMVPTEGSVLYEKEPFEKSWLGKLKVPTDIYMLDNEGAAAQGSVTSFFKQSVAQRLEYIQSQYYSKPAYAQDWEMAVNKLSRGQVYRMNMIAAIESDPKVLIADDYGLHFDKSISRDFNRRINHSAKSRGTTAILSSTSMFDLKSVAAVVITLDNGHISQVRSLKK